MCLFSDKALFHSDFILSHLWKSYLGFHACFLLHRQAGFICKMGGEKTVGLGSKRIWALLLGPPQSVPGRLKRTGLSGRESGTLSGAGFWI